MPGVRKMIEQMPKAGATWNLLPLMQMSFSFKLLRHLFGPAHHSRWCRISAKGGLMKRPIISITTVYLGMVACLVVVMTASGILATEQTQPVPSPAVPPVTPHVTTTPASTSPPTLPAVVAEPSSRPGEAVAGVSEPTLRLYMPDGQLKSHMIRVYVSRNIQPGQDLRLRRLSSQPLTKKAVD